MKNERPKTQQNLLKRERYRAEHKTPKQKIEVAISNLHRNSANSIVTSPRQPNVPAAADSPGRGVRVQRIEERDSRRVHLLCPLVRRKATIKSTRAMRYSSLKKTKKTIQAKLSYLIKNKGNQQTASQPKSKSPLDKFPPMWYTIANRYTRSISRIHKNRIFTHIVSRRYISVSSRRCIFF